MSPSATIPQPDRGRIAALFGETYAPRWVPPGYRYVDWKEKAGSEAAYGTFLEIDFASKGSLLEWVVGDGRDPAQYGYDACLPHPKIVASFGDRIFYVNNQRVVYEHGNHGSTAAICLGNPLSKRFTNPLWAGTAIYVWGDGFTAATLAKMATSWTLLHG
jgi:hypothetical protein